jgi:TonB family protein
MKSTFTLSAAALLLLGLPARQALAQATVRTSAAGTRLASSASPANAPAASAPATTEVLAYAEEMPRFRSQQPDLDSVQLYLQQHLRYPDDAFIGNASGRVFVSFIVNPQGKVEQVKLVKSVVPSLDKEALRVVGAMPTWRAPGRQHGQAVSVAFTVPVVFQMEMAMLTMRPGASRPGTARPSAAATAGTGPSFLGGPDSLRAVLARGARRAESGAQGRVLVEFDLDNEGRTRNVKALIPANAKDRATPAAYAAAVRLIEQLPPWLPGPANSRLRHQLLTLAFGTATLPATVDYASLQFPTFPGSQPTLESLTAYIQRQARYPEAAMERQQQGRVYAYFEVSESGEVERGQIIGSVSPLLDAEVLRVLQSLPRATTPPINSGQAVRASFTLPVSFVVR